MNKRIVSLLTIILMTQFATAYSPCDVDYKLKVYINGTEVPVTFSGLGTYNNTTVGVSVVFNNCQNFECPPCDCDCNCPQCPPCPDVNVPDCNCPQVTCDCPDTLNLTVACPNSTVRSLLDVNITGHVPQPNIQVSPYINVTTPQNNMPQQPPNITLEPVVIPCTIGTYGWVGWFGFAVMFIMFIGVSYKAGYIGKSKGKAVEDEDYRLQREYRRPAMPREPLPREHDRYPRYEERNNSRYQRSDRNNLDDGFFDLPER